MFSQEFLPCTWSFQIRYFYMILCNHFMQGSILYQFPSLQRTASAGRRGKGLTKGTDKVVQNEKFMRENYWNFRSLYMILLLQLEIISCFCLSLKQLVFLQCSNTTTHQKVMVVGLGVLNNLGVFILGALLRYVR